MVNNLKKNNRNAIVAVEMTLATLVTIVLLVSNMATTTPVAGLLTSTRQAGYTVLDPEVPVVVSGDNIYLAWWTNNTSENGNEEVMFRASNDGGATFGEKINLSNTTEADSWRVQIAGEGADVVVSWWETNQTSDVPVARVSTDGGATFGPMLMLGMNGTISETEEGEETAAATEEEGGEGEGEDTAAGVIEEAFGGTELVE